MSYPMHPVVLAAITRACQRYGCWRNPRTGCCNRCGNEC